MKLLIITALLVADFSGFSQTDAAKKSLPSNTTVDFQRAASLDSFDFCGLWFSTFRDCKEGSWKNCCSYYVEPTYVTCTDKGMMAWYSMPSVEIAEMNIKNHLSELANQGKIATTETIYCNVLGKRTKA